MKLSTIACIALPILGVSILLLFAAPVLMEKQYVNPDVERAYEALKSPEERAAFNRIADKIRERAKAYKQAIKETEVEINAQAAIDSALAGPTPTPTSGQVQIEEERRQAEENYNAIANGRQNTEQAERERALEAPLGVSPDAPTFDPVYAPTATPTPSIIVVNGPMTKEQIHALINGPK